MVRLTDRPDMTLDVYRGRKTTMQQQQQQQQQLSSRLPERGRKKRETIGETEKLSEQLLLAPTTASTVGSCPTIIQTESYAAPTRVDRKNLK